MAVDLDTTNGASLATIELYTSKFEVITLFSTENHDIRSGLCQSALHIDSSDLFDYDIASRNTCGSFILIILLNDNSIGSHSIKQNVPPDHTGYGSGRCVCVGLDSQSISIVIRTRHETCRSVLPRVVDFDALYPNVGY